jgi:hypothetical protein
MLNGVTACNTAWRDCGRGDGLVYLFSAADQLPERDARRLSRTTLGLDAADFYSSRSEDGG